MKQLA